MIAAMTGTGAVEPDLVEFLYERSEGNPFFLEEMLNDAVTRLAPDQDLTRAALADAAVPETVRDAIQQRLARLDPDQVAVLEAGAVIGRGFDYPLLLAVSEADKGVAQAALEAAIAQQLLEEHPDYPGRYRWRHALTEEAIHDGVVSPRRQAIHSRTADALAADESSRSVDVANHLLWASRFEEAVPMCLRSAERGRTRVGVRRGGGAAGARASPGRRPARAREAGLQDRPRPRIERGTRPRAGLPERGGRCARASRVSRSRRRGTGSSSAVASGSVLSPTPPGGVRTCP